MFFRNIDNTRYQLACWDLSYEFITSTAALNEWFCRSPEYRAKIEDHSPLSMDLLAENPVLSLEEDREQTKGFDDVPAELTRKVASSERLPVLPPGSGVGRRRSLRVPLSKHLISPREKSAFLRHELPAGNNLHLSNRVWSLVIPALSCSYKQAAVTGNVQSSITIFCRSPRIPLFFSEKK